MNDTLTGIELCNNVTLSRDEKKMIYMCALQHNRITGYKYMYLRDNCELVIVVEHRFMPGKPLTHVFKVLPQYYEQYIEMRACTKK